MRLVQLARKLGITQNEMVDFLQKSGAEHLDSSNTKIDEKYVTLALEHYGYTKEEVIEEPTPIEAAPQEDKKEQIASIVEDIQVVNEEPISEEPPLAEEELSKKEPDPAETPTKVAEIVEVIRAKKIKLEGIKVLGKMELPEPPLKEKKETSADDNKTEEPMPANRKQRPPAKAKSQRNPKKQKATETYEEKLKKQEREAARDKRRREKKLKDKKKKHYEAVAKATKSQKKEKPKSLKKQLEPKATAPKKKVIRHSNPIVRLWQWLNGKYD